MHRGSSHGIWSTAPLFWAALCLAAGIVAGGELWRPALWWAIAIAVLVVAIARWHERAHLLTRAVALLVVFLAGILLTQMAHEPSPDSKLISELADGRPLLVTGYISKESGAIQRASDRRRASWHFQTESITDGERMVAIHTGLRLTVYWKEFEEEDEEQAREPAPDFAYGTRLKFPAKLRQPRNFRNPGSLDYAGYLSRQGITAFASVQADKIETLPGSGGTRLGKLRSEVRRSIGERVRELWPGETGGVLAAMLIGEKMWLDRGLSRDYQRTGVYHILVVSGMNLGILAAPVFLLLRWLRAGRGIATVVTLALAVAYAYLTGMEPPIVRAALMMAIYLATRLLYRDTSALNAVGAAGFIVLALDPHALFDNSFQLTFLAVIAITGIGMPWLERTSLPFRRALWNFRSVPYDFSLAPRVMQFRLDLRMIADRVARLTGSRFGDFAVTKPVLLALLAFDVFFISLLMQLTLALPMVSYFHRATLVSLPANLVIIPFSTLLLPIAALALLLSYAAEWLATIPAVLAGALQSAISTAVAWMGRSPLSDVRIADPPLWIAVAACVAVLLAIVASRRRWTLALPSLALLVLTSALLVWWPRVPQLHAGRLEITVLDVGQGDAILLVSPEGKTLLVDGGGALGGWSSEFDVGEDVIAPYLWSRGITRLDAVMLTHAHADHIGGLYSVMSNFSPAELWVGTNPETYAYKSLLSAAERNSVKVVQRTAGDRVEFGGVAFEFLSPAADWKLTKRPRNDDSLTAMVRFGESSALLAGDVEKRVEKLLVQQAIDADLLKVPHHGSITSTNPEFLAAVTPDFAVISVGARNSFGHPRSEVLERLQAAGARTFRTDVNGAVTFLLDGREVHLPNKR